MDRVQGEPFWFDCSSFADELSGREAFEGLEPSPDVAGAEEVGEVLAQLVVVIAVEAFGVQRENDPPGCCLIVAALGMRDLGQPMFDVMFVADAVEDELEGVNVPFVVG